MAPFLFALSQALNLYARVMGRDGLVARPEFVRKSVAARLVTGVRALEAFLRRVLILMALQIEHDLVVLERPENLARAKARMPCVRKPHFRIYPADGPSQAPVFGHGFSGVYHTGADVSDVLDTRAALVPIDHVLARLDHLHAIAKNPIAKARRLAFSLARQRHGRLMAPPERARMLYRWGIEVSALHDAMAVQIMHKSRSRPPPLPPPRRGPKPMITQF